MQATQKQTDFIRKLLADREGQEVEAIRTLLNAERSSKGFISKAMASAAIKGLLQIAPKAKPSAALNIADGYYVRQEGADSVVYVVVTSKNDRQYGKRLVYTQGGQARWEYARGAVYSLTDLQPLTREEASRLGHLHGICVICARQLTDPESVKNGIGPVCVKKLPDGTSKVIRGGKATTVSVPRPKKPTTKKVVPSPRSPVKPDPNPPRRKGDMRGL